MIRVLKRLLFLIFLAGTEGHAFAQLAISWDQSTIQNVSTGVYSRIVKLNNGTLAMVFSDGPGCQMRLSNNGGTTWGNEIQVAVKPNYNLTNSSMIQLQNGWLLYSYNGRPVNDGTYPYTIEIVISKDEGNTWGTPTVVYSAGVNASDGCWEPTPAQLPSGEIQLFFSNEYPYPPPSSDQEIDLCRSFDNGNTWSAYIQTSYAAGARDGMPVPVYLAKNLGIAYSIESNPGTSLQPHIIWSAADDNWYQGPALNPSPRRWTVDPTVPGGDYLGAPYLIQVSSENTLVSCQSVIGRNSGFENMEVYIGNNQAQNFSPPSTPWPNLPADARAYWNAMCVLNSSTIMATSSISGSLNGLYTVIGHLTGINPPAAPTELMAQNTCSMNLNWNAVGGATGYNIQRGITHGGPYYVIAYNVSGMAYTDSTAVPGQSYYYVVTARNPDEGPPSNEINAVLSQAPLPCPWLNEDLGAPAIAGSVQICNGINTVSGSGMDVFGTSDQCQFVYQPLTGNGSITARVVNQGNSYIWAKAGVIIRNSLNPSDANAYLAVTPDQGINWLWRSAEGASTVSVVQAGLNTPYWVRIVRSGNNFTAFISPDGNVWTQIGSTEMITMGATVYTGLAVTSHNVQLLNTAVLDNVSVTGQVQSCATNTATFTATPTLTNTATTTSTFTPTRTPTPTPTNTSTSPPLFTATNTATNIPTDTLTSTPTKTPTDTPTNSPTNTQTNTATHTSTPTQTFTLSNTLTNTFTPTPTNTTTHKPTHTSTLTPTYTSTETETNTSTSTATNTSTRPPTNTPTFTPTNTVFHTSSMTPTLTLTDWPSVTPTETAVEMTEPVIFAPYPNPSDGLPIHFMVQVQNESTVRLDIFTLAFRNIHSETDQVIGAQTFQWDLKDQMGIQAANGLYYVRIQVSGDENLTKIVKVLILR